MVVVDGRDWQSEKDAFINGTEIIIATPGRLMAHLKMGGINFENLKHLVLDEADRMLDMGFIDDIQTIISYLPKKHQTLLFSATMPRGIRGNWPRKYCTILLKYLYLSPNLQKVLIRKPT